MGTIDDLKKKFKLLQLMYVYIILTNEQNYKTNNITNNTQTITKKCDTTQTKIVVIF